jgi:hypothetical protein
MAEYNVTRVREMIRGRNIVRQHMDADYVAHTDDRIEILQLADAMNLHRYQYATYKATKLVEHLARLQVIAEAHNLDWAEIVKDAAQENDLWRK